MQTKSRYRAALYALFTFSGFAGLIYESIWSHYLKLFLGHAAYAQTLVLVIFMGGMAIGSWLAGDIARRAARPLLWYVAVEALLGVTGFAFDSVFRGMQAWVFDSLIPQLGSPLLVDLSKWSLSAMVILPQSILLGATFPLMSAGIVRRYPRISGSALSWLYFTNSLGASVGVLVSGFVLVDKLGLPGTVFTAGLINCLLAAGVYLIGSSMQQAVPADVVRSEPAVAAATPGLILAGAFLTGAASFFYEVGWIRMLSMVLGSATHSFELMLSAFIFGIAAGAFWIRNRIDGTAAPLRLLGWIQLAMAGFALLSLPLYMHLFGWMSQFWHTVQSNDQGYVLYTLFSYSLCFALMLPATFCAGMTLPLLTAILLRNGHGEASIGRTYAANTVGAICGVLLAIHLVMPLLGVRQVVVAGALTDAFLGGWLLRRAGWGLAERGALAVFAGIAALVLALVPFDPHVTGSGVYRVGDAYLDAEILYHADGKTATVDVARYADNTISIATNGKIDAGLNFKGAVGADDYTMIMLAVIPLETLPQAKTAAVIGMGSGTSSHTLLQNPHMERVDTIEIEPAMIEGARQFGEATHLVFDDPRSHIQIEDAKTYFARSGRRYDLILSEPSNPWVSGIASLFSDEFYAQSKRYLTPQGLFVQWLHMYEIDLPLISTVLNALGRNFDDYVMYANNGDDIMIVASPHGKVPEMSPWVFGEPGFAPPLQRLAMQSPADLQMRRLGGKEVLQPFFASMNRPPNSDYFPVLDQGSGRTRFVLVSARELLQIHPYSLRLERRKAVLAEPLQPPRYYQPIPGVALRAREMAARILGHTPEPPTGLLLTEQALAATLLASTQPVCSDVVRDAVRRVVEDSAYYLDPQTAAGLLARLRAGLCPSQRDEEVSAWLNLLEGITQSQPRKAHDAAFWLLKEALQNDLPGAQFAMAELVLADIQAGGFGAAAQQLAQTKGLPDSVPLQFLRAYVMAHQPPGP